MSTEAQRTDRVRDQGMENGLFRACMDAIRKSHSLGQSLRNAAIATGMLTDKYCYAEMLVQFYVATAALEKRMDELLANEKENETVLVKKIKTLGYSFQSGYEDDLEALLGPHWKETITSWTTDPAKCYIKRIQSANCAQCAAALFILHGPLIIGGGAALKPRIEKAFGKDATHVFESVIGASRGGRSGRRREFIECYDRLLSHIDEGNDEVFNEVVDAVKGFMDLNNEMMIAVKQSPWWHKYAKVCLVVAVSYILQRHIVTKEHFRIVGTTKT